MKIEVGHVACFRLNPTGNTIHVTHKHKPCRFLCVCVCLYLFTSAITYICLPIRMRDVFARPPDEAVHSNPPYIFSKLKALLENTNGEKPLISSNGTSHSRYFVQAGPHAISLQVVNSLVIYANII